MIWAVPLQAILLLWRLDLLDPWGDEGFTLTTAPQPLREIASICAGNIHPPLYFFLLHLWIQIPWAGTVLVKMRALSVFWGLLSTVILYLLWLRREAPRFQRIVLAFWVLSPCLLLYARMARSYTMQLALSLIAIHAAVQWIEQPRNWRKSVTYISSCVALLYTHYVPGLAILAAASSILLIRKRAIAVAGSTALIIILYLPWLATIRTALMNWTASEPYHVGNFLTDQAVRLVYWFVSFSFGETLSTLSVLLAVVMTPVVVYALSRAAHTRPTWLCLVTGAAGFGYIGVSRWSGFPFTPSHVLFTLPFFLMLLVRGFEESFRWSSPALAGLAVILVSGTWSYFDKSGYLNKVYCVPNEQIAATIQTDLPATGSVVILDSVFPDPLVERLGHMTQVILLGGEESADAVLEEIRRQPATVIWFCRRTHDTSLGGLVTRLERELSQNRKIKRYEFLPYGIIERWILRWLRGPGQPDYSYRLVEMK